MTSSNVLADRRQIDTQSPFIGEDPHVRNGQYHDDNHGAVAVPDPDTPPTSALAIPIDQPSAESYLPGDQKGLGRSHLRHVSGEPNIRSGQVTSGTQDGPAIAEQSPDQARLQAEPKAWPPGRAKSPRLASGTARPMYGSLTGGPICGGHLAADTHTQSAAAPNSKDPANEHSTPKPAVLGLSDPLLALAADVLDDLEKVRIANENRLRQLTRDETDKDGEERGFGLPVHHPDVVRLAALVEALATAEHSATLNLQRMVRKHPLGPWIKRAQGVGEKQAARLLAAIGDPYWNTLHNRPRTVSELWAFCGYHVLPVSQFLYDAQDALADGDPTPAHLVKCDPHLPLAGVAASRQRGQKSNWSAAAKMRAHLVAESCMKGRRRPCPKVSKDDDYGTHIEGCQCFPYRVLYDQARAKYVDAVHGVDCKRCGPAGKPAQSGSPLSDGHKHARALRLVAKAVLKDLWVEAKRIHEQDD